MERTAALVNVSGRVQGVFFRASARDEALSLGLSGWVRNLPDGSVQLLLEGEDARVKEMIAWCHEGPPSARVDEVRVIWTAPQGEKGFGIRW